MPSPIRLRHSGCPILERTGGEDSQRALGEIFKTLTIPVPRNTQLIHLLPQPIPYYMHISLSN